MTQISGNRYRIGKIFNGTYCTKIKVASIHVCRIQFDFHFFIWKSTVAYRFIKRKIFNVFYCSFYCFSRFSIIFQYFCSFFNTIMCHAPCCNYSPHLLTSSSFFILFTVIIVFLQYSVILFRSQIFYYQFQQFQCCNYIVLMYDSKMSMHISHRYR